MLGCVSFSYVTVLMCPVCGYSRCAHWPLNTNRASALRIFPFWSVWPLQGGGLWGTAAVFGGRPACLQLCFLRPCESSQTGPSQRSSQRSAPFSTCQSSRQTARRRWRRKALSTVTKREAELVPLFFVIFYPHILFLWLSFAYSSGKKPV